MLAAALLGGCANFAEPIGGERAAPLSPEEARRHALEEKVADLNRRVQNLNLAALSQDNLRLEQEIRSLRGEVERLTFLIESAEKRSKELYLDLDRRLQQVESERRSARLSIDETLPQVGAPAGASAAPSATPEEESMYLQVFDQLKAGRYDEAITGFRTMLDRWPDGRYADNAWYWLGESHYVKRNFKAAQESFEKLLARFPDSRKRPDALFKLGLALLEQKQEEAGRAALQQVVQDHPQSNAASLARQRLAQLR